MTDDDAVLMGNLCENLLQEPYFNALVQGYELNCFAEFRASEPKNVKEREAIYAKLEGVRDFLNHIAKHVHTRDAILAQQALSPEDAPINGID